MWGKIMISMYRLWQHGYVDYMDLAVCCSRKAVKLNHSLTHSLSWLLLPGSSFYKITFVLSVVENHLSWETTTLYRRCIQVLMYINTSFGFVRADIHDCWIWVSARDCGRPWTETSIWTTGQACQPCHWLLFWRHNLGWAQLGARLDGPEGTDATTWNVETFLIASFMGPTWGPPGADWTQVGPMLAPWTLLSEVFPIIAPL